MPGKRKINLPKPRIPLPRKPPKIERDERKERSRRTCRKPIRPGRHED